LRISSSVTPEFLSFQPVGAIPATGYPFLPSAGFTQLTDMKHYGSSQGGVDVVPWFCAGPQRCRVAVRAARRLFSDRGYSLPLGPAQEEEPSMDSSHVSALQFKHAGIERQIHEELSRPMPDAVVVQALKRRKLKIKEEIARF
jgi:hypothetical protein